MRKPLRGSRCGETEGESREGGGDEDGGSEAAADDDVVEADYEIVDEEA